MRRNCQKTANKSCGAPQHPRIVTTNSSTDASTLGSTSTRAEAAMNRAVASSETALSRRAFAQRCVGLAAVALVNPGGALRPVVAGIHHSPATEHPEPRPGITSEHVLAVET